MRSIEAAAIAMPLQRLAWQRWLALPVSLAGTFMVTLDFFVVNVAIPSLQRDLHAGSAAIEWVVAGYGLAYAALLIIGGRLGDLCGRRRIFCCGIALFTLASLGCGIAPSAAVLVLGRLGQGVGAALLTPQVLAILGTLPGPDRARAFAAYGVVLGVASACGQLIGGLLIEADPCGLGWRACFLVNLPLGVAALLLAPIALPESRGGNGSRLDLTGAVLATLAIGALLLPLIEGRARGWPVWTWTCFIGALLLAACLALHLRRLAARGGEPLFDPAVLRFAGFRRGLLAVLALFAGVASSFFVLALYLQQGRSMAPLPSGLVFSAMAATFSVTSLCANRIAERLGRAPLVLGAGGMAAGLATLSLTAVALPPDAPVAWLLPGLLLDGAGMGLVMAPLAAAVLADVPSRHAGGAAGVLATLQQSGNAIGVAAVGVLFFSVLPQGGYRIAFAACMGCLALLALALMWLVARLPAQRRR